MKRIAFILLAAVMLLLVSCSSGNYRYVHDKEMIISSDGTKYLKYPYSWHMTEFSKETLLGSIEYNDTLYEIYSLADNCNYIIADPPREQNGKYILIEYLPVFIKEGVECPTVFDRDKVKSITFIPMDVDNKERIDRLKTPDFSGEAACELMKKLTEYPTMPLPSDEHLGSIYVQYQDVNSVYFKYLICSVDDRIVLSDDAGNDFELNHELYNELTDNVKR